MDDGKRALPSKIGALCSILLIIILLLYSGYKISILEGKKDIDIIQAVKKDNFDDSYEFSAEQGFNIAVAVFDPFDLRSIKGVDPRYGRIRFIKNEWGQYGNNPFNTFTEINSHECGSQGLI